MIFFTQWQEVATASVESGISVISQVHFLGKSWVYLGYISGMSHVYLGYIFGISQVYLVYITGIS